MKLPRGLYVITDTQLIPQDNFVATVEQAILGGAQVVQYRDKTLPAPVRYQQAYQLRELCHRYAIPLIINDDVELARQVGAEGVHLGKNDDWTQVTELKTELGVGVSCYNQVALANYAVTQGANYVAFGSFFASATKPHATAAQLEILQHARQTISCPMVAIGGITPENGRLLVELGADNLAVISGVFGQADVQAAAARYARLFTV